MTQIVSRGLDMYERDCVKYIVNHEAYEKAGVS